MTFYQQVIKVRYLSGASIVHTFYHQQLYPAMLVAAARGANNIVLDVGGRKQLVPPIDMGLADKSHWLETMLKKGNHSSISISNDSGRITSTVTPLNWADASKIIEGWKSHGFESN